MTMDYPRRISRVREYLARKRLSSGLIVGEPNIYYLTGLLRLPGNLVVTPKDLFFFASPMFLSQAQAMLQFPRVQILEQNGFDRTVKALKKTGFIASEFTVARKAGLDARIPVLVPLENFVQDLRAVKEPGESALIVQAAAIARKVMCQVKRMLREGVTEYDIAAEIYYRVRASGGHAEAFAPVVAFGPNTAFPHHEPGGRRLRKGDPAMIDLGVEYRGYKSDATETVFPLGSSGEMRRIYQCVKAVKKACEEAARCGVRGADVHNCAVKLFRAAGREEHFTHGLGHGVGIEVHERPFLNSVSRDILRRGMVFTVEPGLYVPGCGGVRLESIRILN